MKLALAPFASRQFRLLFTGELISFLRTAAPPRHGRRQTARGRGPGDLRGAAPHLGGASAYGAIVAAQGAGLLLGGVLSLRWRARRPLLVGTLELLPTGVTIACYAGLRTTAVIATAPSSPASGSRSSASTG